MGSLLSETFCFLSAFLASFLNQSFLCLSVIGLSGTISSYSLPLNFCVLTCLYGFRFCLIHLSYSYYLLSSFERPLHKSPAASANSPVLGRICRRRLKLRRLRQGRI